MKLDFEITREDYAGFNKHHFIKKRLKRTILFVALLIVLVEISDGKEFDLNLSIMTASITLPIIFLIYVLALYSTRYMALKNGSILGSREMEFTDENITCKTKDSQMSSNWSAVKSFQKGNKAYYLYLDKNCAYIIPKRAFQSQSDQENFERYVTSKLG